MPYANCDANRGYTAPSVRHAVNTASVVYMCVFLCLCTLFIVPIQR